MSEEATILLIVDTIQDLRASQSRGWLNEVLMSVRGGGRKKCDLWRYQGNITVGHRLEKVKIIATEETFTRVKVIYIIYKIHTVVIIFIEIFTTCCCFACLLLICLITGALPYYWCFVLLLLLCLILLLRLFCYALLLLSSLIAVALPY